MQLAVFRQDAAMLLVRCWLAYTQGSMKRFITWRLSSTAYEQNNLIVAGLHWKREFQVVEKPCYQVIYIPIQRRKERQSWRA